MKQQLGIIEVRVLGMGLLFHITVDNITKELELKKEFIID